MRISVSLWLTLHVATSLTSAVFRPPKDPTDVDTGDSTGDVPWHPNWEPVVRCEPRQKHAKFPRCFCGQFAMKLKKEFVHMTLTPWEELELEGIYTKWNGPQKIYYICLPCSSCPDGVRMRGYCRQGRDTLCEPLECIDPHHVFDSGIKACVPRPHLGAPLSNSTDGNDLNDRDPLLSTQMPHTPTLSTSNSDEKSIIADRHMSKLEHIIAVGVIFAAVVGIELFLLIVFLFGRHFARKKILRTPDQPCVLFKRTRREPTEGDILETAV